MTLLCLIACTTPPGAQAPAAGGSAGACTPSDAAVEVVSLTAADGVVLAADWYAAGDADPFVVLLHMIPPSWDRTSWASSFIADLRAECFGVLALDRRGAGESEGVAEDAYTGDLGVNDARAAVEFGSTRTSGDVSIVGASNGTTTALDYAVTAADAGYPAPASMVFWSPGSYTETNHRMGELELARLMLVYPSSEADWPESKRTLDPGTWTWDEYAGTRHGTTAFGTANDPGAEIVAFIAG